MQWLFVSFRKNLWFVLSVSWMVSANAQAPQGINIGNGLYTIHSGTSQSPGFSYVLKENNHEIPIRFPTMEIDGKKINLQPDNLILTGNPTTLVNNAKIYTCQGSVTGKPDLRIQIDFQVAPDNPVLRFRYRLLADEKLLLTKTGTADDISYLGFQANIGQAKELSFSKFDERFHATHLAEQQIDPRYFEDSMRFMGPMLVTAENGTSFLVAYEHGSQYGDHFLEFQLSHSGYVRLNAVKGNYLNGEPANHFSSPWFEMAAVKGTEDLLAENYRSFILNYISVNRESRKPYIFYNPWGRQEKKHFRDGSPYYSTVNLDQILKEIDRSHEMGIDVYVIDVGWFTQAGDWNVDLKAFPDTLGQVKRKLAAYGMKLGLWFNPTMAALKTKMYANNISNRITWNDTVPPPTAVWESPLSSGMCLVSSYWEDYADRLIGLIKQLGITYFKWDAISQYGCNDAHHFHGSDKNTAAERADRYAFLQPLYMTKIIERVSAVYPETIFDFDITEPGRCVGLEFLTAGKYFIINNGPYFHNYDMAETWKSPLPNGNANIFVYAGPARGWFLRSVLDYDKWIPSNLFLTHYLPDGPESSQLINIGSLILGQNGIWGEILLVDESGTRLFGNILSKYKNIRNDIELGSIVSTGLPGESPEIYEKINPATGKGCIVLFSNSNGNIDYVSKNAVHQQHWNTANAEVGTDSKGRAVIHAHFKGSSAAIILFGTE